MTNLFLDTDIILDFLGDRRPFSRYAVRIFAGVHAGEYTVYTSGNSITTAYYILCKTTDEKVARALITDLLDYIKVIPVTESILRKAMISDFADFEDAVQHESAITVSQIQFIITRNLRDYKKSRVKAIGPEGIF